MKDLTTPKIGFVCCITIGFGILCAHWIISGDTVGFFLMLFMICLTLLRWRAPKFSNSIGFDIAAGVIFFPLALGLSLFSAMYYRRFWAVLALAVVFVDLYAGAIAALGALAGLFLGLWEKERDMGRKWRDSEAERFYELEALQNELVATTAQIERMSVVSERARIAREIHDNAGHEIVAAYMSLQTAREVIGDANPDALVLYDAALERLDKGVNKIRDAVHNLAPVTALGVEALRETCDCFTAAVVKLNVFGDTAHVPVHVWSVLEACLNETLTNAVRHARPDIITVNLDTTPHIVRICVENKAGTMRPTMGNGLRNLRHRAAAVGGSLSVDPGKVFRVICVIPIAKASSQAK